jgi:ubiquinone/menaquinone biosynthesis C-methylase UbiE
MRFVPTDEQVIAANVRRYRFQARSYVRRHDEIFNTVESDRLRASLKRALAFSTTEASHPHVLDFGCGSGNVTEQLVSLGARVTAADVSPEFLRMVGERFPDEATVHTHRLNGRDLDGIPDGSFDMVTTYSVLHHVPDYLSAVSELCRVLLPGGVLYIDHEAAPNVWAGDDQLEGYRAAVSARELASMRRFLDPSYLRQQARRQLRQVRRRLLRDPRYWEEGDLHVWPDDHIEWERVRTVVERAGLSVMEETDYLLRRARVPSDIYDRYRDATADTRLLIARRG